jgi:quercetin dioxygenase-like cupin family protein
LHEASGGRRSSGAARAPRKTAFALSRASRARFRRQGLRAYFEYRDLGIAKATGGRFHAHVIRARKGQAPSGEAHRHRLDFQMVYVLKGWVEFHYEGVGRVRLKAGDCVHQPPGIRHAELAHSDDLELLEITSPAAFETIATKRRPRP